MEEHIIVLHTLSFLYLVEIKIIINHAFYLLAIGCRVVRQHDSEAHTRDISFISF